jgi:small subunit ribosomal protein S2
MSTNPQSTLIDRLFAAGAHFGFKKSRRHPTVTPFLYATKEGNDIIDLEKSAALLESAKTTLKEVGQNGKTVLFVGTKTEITKLVEAAAKKANMPFVVNRWIGGMMTNFPEMKKRISRLEQLNQGKETGELERKYTKKERMVLGREADKLAHNFSGISNLAKLPDFIVVVDPRHDQIAVKEAKAMKVPVIAIMSSDSNITEVKYPVVVNDALQSSVKLVLDELVESYLAGVATFVPRPVTPRTSARTAAK